MAEAPLLEWRVERHEVIDSTQEELRRRLIAGEEIDRLVVRAGAQTMGKGRRADEWRSGPGGSYQSLAVSDWSGSLRSSYFPLAIAVGIAEAFHDRGVAIALKWPNDLHLWNEASSVGPMSRLPGKIGGILCQYLRNHLLVGVGINVRNEPPPGAGALPGLDPADVSDLVLAAVARSLVKIDPRLPDRFARFDPLTGRVVRLRTGDRTLLGRCAGTTSEGCLLLETREGRVEVSDGHIVEIDAAVAGSS
ncbi:MAG TPA: biotin--[acetyl-CoA-carboxylase] ligase [Trueperaceae bacterium]